MREEIHIRIQLTRPLVGWLLFAAFLVLTRQELGSETLTLTTTYPSPSGIYKTLVTTDAVTLARNANNVVIGNGIAHHRLRILGGPAWTTSGWSGEIELENGSAIGWNADAAGQAFGIGHTNGGLY